MHTQPCFGLLACFAVQAVSAQFQTIDRLKTAYPPALEYNHAAELLATELPYSSDVIDSKVQNVKHMPFDKALTLEVKTPGSSLYAVNMRFLEKNHWKKGDSGLIAFYARTVETQNRFGASSFMLQYKPEYADWHGHVQLELYLTRDWKLVLIPFEIAIDAEDTPETALNLFFGGVDPHTFQIADLRVFSYGTSFSRQDLPRSEAYYPGMEANAAWRKAAEARIEKYRKADLELHVLDSQGNPVPNVKILAVLQRHRFGFGAAVHSPMLVSPDVSAETRRKYSDILTRSCSKITTTNAMKWRLYEHFKQHMPPLIAWCEKYDMTLRGHLFIWPGFDRLPEGYDLYKTDPAAFRKDLVRHIREFANLYPEAFSEWDVLNEPYTEHAFMDLLSKEVVLEWFLAAREANPNYLTYINDYDILSDNNAEHQDNYYDWISYLVDNHAPLDGIGFQGHFTTAMPPELILERIERFASFGKKMQITEFDFDHIDPALQARFFEDFVTLIYSQPQMEALINWIYLEDDFRPAAALYRKDFTPTAMGRVWERLLTRDWHTEETLTTDAKGVLSLRGFKGNYEITVNLDGQTFSYDLTLSDDLAQTLVIPPKD